MVASAPQQDHESSADRARAIGGFVLAGVGLACAALAPSLAHLGLLLALALCVGLPALPRLQNLALLLIPAGLVAALRFDPSSAALALSYLGLCGLALLGVERLSERAGQAAASGLGLVALALPYLAGALPMGPEAALGLVLHSPLPILSGTCAGEDLLRQGSLYRLLPAAQSVPYAYASPLAALGSAGLVALLAWAPALWRRLRPSPRLSGALAACVLAGLLLAPQEAQAQGLFPSPTPQNTGGDLTTRVRLGYFLPILEGNVRLDTARSVNAPRRGEELDWDRQLDLDPNFLVPTFEVELAWEQTGGLRMQYIESHWRGEVQNNQRVFQVEEQRINVSNILETRYVFRTIALGGYIDVPLMEFLNARVMTTFRYVKNEIKIRASPQGISVRNSQESIVPTVGGGLDVFVWNIISVYGDIQWLDFRTSVLGGEDDRWRFRYREWRAGVRLELVEHAHVSVEWYSLYLDIRDYNHETYKTDIQGIRVMVSIAF